MPQQIRRVVQVLLCWTMTCPCVQGRSEVSEGHPGVAKAKSVNTTLGKRGMLTQGTQVGSHGHSLFFDYIGDSGMGTGGEIFRK